MPASIIIQGKSGRTGPRGGVRFFGGSGSSETFYPTTLPDPLLLLDAVESSYVDAGSGRVSQWEDLSGNSNHAVQATSANQPTYNATGFNGLPTMVLGATPVRFDLTATITASPKTIYIVASLDDAASSGAIIGHTTGLDGIIYFTSGGQKIELLGSGNGGYHGFLDYPFARTSGAGFLMTVTNANATGTSNTGVYNNGTSQTSTFGTGFDGIQTSRIGYIDASASYNKMNGKMSGLYIYGSVHDTTTRQAMEAYLIDRWGIA